MFEYNRCVLNEVVNTRLYYCTLSRAVTFYLVIYSVDFNHGIDSLESYSRLDILKHLPEQLHSSFLRRVETMYEQF